MKSIYGYLLILLVAIEMIMKSEIDFYGIAACLGSLCLFIIKEKFWDNEIASGLFLTFVLVICFFYRDCIVLMGIAVLDFSYFKRYYICLVTLFLSIILCIKIENFNFSFYIISAGFVGYILGAKEKNEAKHLILLDEERWVRYNLELTQKELIKSKQEIEHFTEIRERNRISQDIHDNIGHSLAGVIFQLEAAAKIINNNTEKAQAIIKLCSNKLGEALELTRNTVYNIKVDKRVGLSSLKLMVCNFKTCKVNFEHIGDFTIVSKINFDILESNMMEALTNASKYSKATEIQIKIEVNKHKIRFYYKDNGIGCQKFHENLGIQGMKERVKNVNGTISIDGTDGFLIVCNLPIQGEGILIENSYS